MALVGYSFVDENNNDLAGFAVISLGDIDGDGIDDFIITAPNGNLNDANPDNNGTAYLISGVDLRALDQANDTGGAEDGRINLENVAEIGATHPAGPDSIGSYEIGLGDIGSQNPAFDNTTNFPINEATLFGQHAGVFGLRDNDNDGDFDTSTHVIINAVGTDNFFANGPDSGAAYLINYRDLAPTNDINSADTLPTVTPGSESYQFLGHNSGDMFGFSITSVGDFDGDGIDDLLISAPWHDDNNDSSDGRNGAAYLISGADFDALDAIDNALGSGNNRIGASVLNKAFTIDNIGQLDSTVFAGHVFNSYKIIAGETAADTDAQFGSSTSVIASDENGDGLLETDFILIGAQGFNGDIGQVHIVSTASADLDAADAADTPDTTNPNAQIDDNFSVNSAVNSYKINGENTGDNLGSDISETGHTNAADPTEQSFLIGAENGGDQGEGAAYLITDSDADGFAALDAADGTIDGEINLDSVVGNGVYKFVGEDAGNRVGAQNTLAFIKSTGFERDENGDLILDGNSDPIPLPDFIIIGSPGEDRGNMAEPASDVGAVYIIDARDLDALDLSGDGTINLANVAGIGAQTGNFTYKILGAAENGQLGISVSDAGDLDGDGINDILIGASGDGAESFVLFSKDLSRFDRSDGFTDHNITADSTIVCFTRGTHITTDRGPILIENLAVGDMVLTLDRGFQPIRWIGSTKTQGDDANTPILIRKGALGNQRDLRVSPQHRMLLSGWQAELLFGEFEVLIAAKKLNNDSSIIRDKCNTVEYFHILFDAHEIIYAEDCLSESFYLGNQAWTDLRHESRLEIISLFPHLEETQTEAYGPLARPSLSNPEINCLKHYMGL